MIRTQNQKCFEFVELEECLIMETLDQNKLNEFVPIGLINEVEI